MSKQVTVFAPATVANVGPGFDIFGFALEGIGDTITVKFTNDTGISISGGQHCESIPTDPANNVAGVAVQAMLDASGISGQGIHLHIEKNIVPGSGLGSSASSASGAVAGVNALLDLGYTKEEMIRFAMIGEGAGGGTPHADNVAPCLLGGFTVVRSYEPLDVIKLPRIPELYVAIVHPQLEVRTSDSKKMLKKELDMKVATKQWGNVAGMITALLSDDFALLGRSMEDHVAVPVRSMMIPGYDEIIAIAKKSGAIGASISGSGPSIFAFCHNEAKAKTLTKMFGKVFSSLEIEYNLYESKINPNGVYHEIY